MIIRTDVFKMSVLHSKSLWNCAQLYKAQSFIQMAGVNIAFYNSTSIAKIDVSFFIQASLFSQFSKPVLNSLFSGTSVSLGNLSLNGKAFFYCSSLAG